MAFRLNYGQQRAEHQRAKLAKQEKKLQEKQEAAARRKAAMDAGLPDPDLDSPAPEEGEE